jgi:hypothetical protein
MRRRTLTLITLACVGIPLALAACRRSETPAAGAPPPVQSAPPASSAAFRVTTVDIGKAIGPDKRVTAPVAVVAPGDTVYASVTTDGTAPSVTLTARWLYEDGQLVNESAQTITPTGREYSEFHISKPDGLPTGRYQVQILAGGSPVASKQFEVR